MSHVANTEEEKIFKYHNKTFHHCTRIVTFLKYFSPSAVKRQPLMASSSIWEGTVAKAIKNSSVTWN